MASITCKIMSQITTKFLSKNLMLSSVYSSKSSICRLKSILGNNKNFIRYHNNDASSSQQQSKAQQQQEQQSNNFGTLKLSETCLTRLKEVCNDGSFLRVTVEGGGCSGFTYKFDLDKKLNDDDIIFGDDKNGKVVIDPVSLEYCSGATVDYHIELIRAGFRIVNNPKAEAGCSCGASFALRLD